MRNIERLIIRTLIIGAVLCASLLARDDNTRSLSKPSTLEFVQFTGNNITNWMGNNGQLTSHIPDGDAGCEWPAGSGKTAVFTSGIWVLGKVDSDLRSAATEYVSEWAPGGIPYDPITQQPITISPPNTPDHQIYSIQRGNSPDPSSPHYNREYATWPASEGAPAHDGELFTDSNGNGSWDPGEPYEDFDIDNSYDAPDGEYVTGEDPPKFIGEEMAWYVMNDMGEPVRWELWDTNPLGVEAQVLTYNRTEDPIYDNIQFYDVKLINKGGNQIDSTYFSIWSDFDLGNATDDQGGCDTSLSLGYFYNGDPEDQDYGLTPPALGYTFLQGPMTDSVGDTVFYEDSSYPDRIVRGMTSHILLLKSNPMFGDPENADEGYFYAQGRMPNGDPIVDPDGNVTPFHVSGNPVVGDPWTALRLYSPYDKRSLISSGPFTMEPWLDDNLNGKADFGEPGVQVIHAALIIVRGIDYLNSITSLKFATKKVHSDFAQDFTTPALGSPDVNVSAHDGEIILNWQSGKDDFEAFDGYGYGFEGYNIYQGETGEGPWTRLKTYDIENGVGLIAEDVMDEYGYVSTELAQYGDDSGLQHLLSITEDALNDHAPLVNNKLYHFAFSAYAYNPVEIPKTLESPLQVFSIRPRNTFGMAGVRDSLAIVEVGDSDVDVTVDVLDPAQLTGLNYQLGFDYDSTQSKARWHVTRRSVSFQDTAIHGDWYGMDYFSDYYYRGESLYLDGFELSFDEISFIRPKFNHSWQHTTNIEGNTHETLTLEAKEPGGVDSLAWDTMGTQLVHMDTLFGPDNYWDYYEIEERYDGTYFILYRENLHDVRIQAFASHFGAIGGDRIADIPGVGGGSENVDFLQSDLEIRFTEAGQKATRYQRGSVDTLISIPFEVWDIERDIQLCIGIKDNNNTGVIHDTSLIDWENTLDLDWVITFDRDYQIYADSLMSFWDNPYSGWAWNFRNESKYSIGDKVQLHFLNPIDPAVDVFTWSTGDLGSAYDENALESIQVFPNPYFGYHQDQTSFTNPYVTFSNLPKQETTIRIYSLGGHLVKRIDHDGGAYENWDLRNEHAHRVASGIYIVHVEVPELGHKVLKLAILQPER